MHNVELGKIVRAHGVRGRLVMRLDDSLLDALVPGVALELRSPNNDSPRVFTLERADRHGKGLLLALEGIQDRTAADPWVGGRVWIDRSALPQTKTGEYYDFEIVGSDVVTADGRMLGRISEIMVTGANDVYIAEGPDGEILIPAVDGAVLEIDTDNARVIVDPQALEYQDSKGAPPK